MNKNTDKNTYSAFILGVLVCAVLLSPWWLFGGISTEEAADIVVEHIYSEVGKEGYLVDVASAEKVGDGLYRIDASVSELTASKNVTYLVTKDGKIILDESGDIEGQEEKDTQEKEKTDAAPSSGRTVAGVHTKGPEDAKVTIIEYSDFECPFCKRYYDGAYKQVLEAYPNDVKVIFKDFPLSFHAQATPAAEAAECAGAQGKYWEYHDKLFENQNDWSTAGRTAFDKYAEDLGLDMSAFGDCVNNREFKENVEADFREGQAKGVRGTPAFFINDKLISGAQPFSTFQAEIDAALAAAG